VRGGQSDLLSPEIAQRMQSSIAGSQLVDVPKAGHSVPLDNPEGFATAVRGFLT
jgi:pimeloyl-ACP methyl ester carboxylesterase